MPNRPASMMLRVVASVPRLTPPASAWASHLGIARGRVRETRSESLNQEAIMLPHFEHPQEWKLVSLRECQTPAKMQICDSSEQVANYWQTHIPSHPYFNPDCECLVVVLLNTRRKIKGHHLVSIGTLDTIIVHPREVFRLAIVAAASAVVLIHNHPSGEPAPSDADIRVTYDLIRAGELLKIEVCDHVIMGHRGNHASLKALGYFSV